MASRLLAVQRFALKAVCISNDDFAVTTTVDAADHVTHIVNAVIPGCDSRNKEGYVVMASCGRHELPAKRTLPIRLPPTPFPQTPATRYQSEELGDPVKADSSVCLKPDDCVRCTGEST